MYANERSFSLIIQSSSEVYSLNRSLVTTTPSIKLDCGIYDTKSIRFDFEIGKVPITEVTLNKGFIIGSSGIFSLEQTFHIQYMNENVLVYFAHTGSTQRIPVHIIFSQEMNEETLMDYIVVDNGIINLFSFHDKEGDFVVSPITTGDIVITVLHSMICLV